MKRLLGLGTGLAMVLLAGQAYAAPTCNVATIPVTNGEFVPDSLLGTGVCAQSADKLYGNFNFGNLPAGGQVLFSWTGTGTAGTHTEEFVGQLTASTNYVGIGFEVAVTTPGFNITQLTGDFDQTAPDALISTLTKNGVTCTRTGSGGTCPLAIIESTRDLVIAESLSLGVNADTGAIINRVTEAAVPEPASLAILGVGLLGLGFVASRKRSV